MVPMGAVLVAATVATEGMHLRPAAVLLVWLACITPSLVRIDLAEHRLPNRIVLPALALAVPLGVLDAIVVGRMPIEPLLTGLLVGGALYACAAFGGLGMGDVKLGALLGVTVGCFGVAAVLPFAVVSICSAGVVGAIVVVATRSAGGSAGWRTRIPFGPFLLLGCWSAVALAVITG
jgi:leader peptidase (prepilin peptidase)/N-methyltransferase